MAFADLEILGRQFRRFGGLVRFAPLDIGILRHVDLKALRQERMAGTGCRNVKQGRAVRCRLGDFKAFIRARTVRSTAEADCFQRSKKWAV